MLNFLKQSGKIIKTGSQKIGLKWFELLNFHFERNLDTMKSCLTFFPLIFFFFGCNPEGGESVQSKNKPNIVFLFADDFTYSAIHAMGNNLINTPNLDRLTRSGTSFTHAYNMGGWHGAICVASRSMIISGTSIWEALEVEKQWQQSDGQAVEDTWGRLMERQGYHTYMTGKWHTRADVEKVFQTTNDVQPGGMPPDYWVGNDSTGRIISEAYADGRDLAEVLPLGYNRPLNEQDTLWSASDPTHGGYWKGGTHWSEVVKNNALDFIGHAEKSDDPFFMYLAFNAPHDPRQAPQQFLDMYPLEDIPLPESWLPEYPYKDSIGNSPTLRDEALAPYPRTPLAIKTHMKEYYAIVSHLDQQIGEILDALEAAGKMDNTYIFFTGDHGLSVGRHGLIGKQSLFDHSIRVPLMIAGPDIPKDNRVSEEVYLQDIMATSLQLAGIEKPSYVYFNSFLDLVQGRQKESHYPAIYGAYVNFQRMIRKDGFKLLVYPKVNKVLLFDLENDPNEIADLSEIPKHGDRVRSLFADLVELQLEMKDSLDLSEIQSNL